MKLDAADDARATEMYARFQALLAAWRATVPEPAGYEERFGALKTEADALFDNGLWTSGPADLLSVLGRHGDELFHSRMLAWLLDPSGRHGLRSRFRRKLLDSIWPGESLAETGPVEVETEVTASDVTDETGERLEARADLVLYSDGLIIVLENKVGAGEQPLQCERLYWSWARKAPDVRFIFLTPTGGPPTSALSPRPRAAWRTVTYRQVRDALASAVGQVEGPLHTGKSSVLQYLATLDAHTTFTGRR